MFGVRLFLMLMWIVSLEIYMRQIKQNEVLWMCKKEDKLGRVMTHVQYLSQEKKCKVKIEFLLLKCSVKKPLLASLSKTCAVVFCSYIKLCVIVEWICVLSCFIKPLKLMQLFSVGRL